MTAPAAPRRKGRPVLGAIAGLLFGLFLGLDLVLFRTIALGTLSTVVLPIVFLLLGLGLGIWAPFGKGRGHAPPPAYGGTPPSVTV